MRRADVIGLLFFASRHKASMPTRKKVAKSMFFDNVVPLPPFFITATITPYGRLCESPITSYTKMALPCFCRTCQSTLAFSKKERHLLFSPAIF